MVTASNIHLDRDAWSSPSRSASCSALPSQQITAGFSWLIGLAPHDMDRDVGASRRDSAGSARPPGQRRLGSACLRRSGCASPLTWARLQPQSHYERERILWSDGDPQLDQLLTHLAFGNG